MNMKLIGKLVILMVVALLMLSSTLPVSAQSVAQQIEPTSQPSILPGDGDRVEGDFFAAFATVGGFICFNVLILFGLAWYFNRRRQA